MFFTFLLSFFEPFQKIDDDFYKGPYSVSFLASFFENGNDQNNT